MSGPPKEGQRVTIFWIWENSWYIPPETSRREKQLICQELYGPFTSPEKALEGKINLERIHLRLDEWLKKTHFVLLFGTRFNYIKRIMKEEVVPLSCLVDQFPNDPDISGIIFNRVDEKDGKRIELVYLVNPEYKDLAYMKLTRAT